MEVKNHYFVVFTAIKNGVPAYGNTCCAVDNDIDPSLLQLDLRNQFNVDFLFITFYAPITEAVYDKALARDVSAMEFIQNNKKG